ncbi:MAG: LysE family translocator [Acidobacteriota bacterium]
MPEPHVLALFVATALALLVTPGPAVLYIVGRSLQSGVGAGLVSALGLTSGGLVHMLAAVFGLAAVLASSATAFHVVQFAGAAYLVYLGVKTLRTSGDGSSESDESPRETGPGAPTRERAWRHFADGFVVNVLNPKSVLFFLALLPQFTDPSAGAVRLQMLLLGLLFLALGMFTDSVYAVAAGSIGRWLDGRPSVALRSRRAVGLVYIGLGVAAALGGRHRV